MFPHQLGGRADLGDDAVALLHRAVVPLGAHLAMRHALSHGRLITVTPLRQSGAVSLRFNPGDHCKEGNFAMIAKTSRVPDRRRISEPCLGATLVLAALASSPAALAQTDTAYFLPNKLMVSRVVYDNNPNNVVAGVTQLPPNCAPANCVTATDDGTYPYVWNNALVDGSFGITAKIILDQLTPSRSLLNSLEVPNSSQHGVPPTKDQMVGSFSSKSELALNLSIDGQYLTFMGYLAPINALDVSNANTPGVIDPTNPVPGANYRVVAQLDQRGTFRFTETNAYSGNNGRAAILNDSNGTNVLYAAGNAGNGGNPQPDGIIIGAGAQILTPKSKLWSRNVRAIRPRSAASTSPSSATNRTRSGRIPTFAG